MKKKKVAWLLIAAMLATSVDGSALLVNGADFTSEAEEVQEPIVESEASELGEAKEEGTEEVQETESADGSDAELNLENGAEELTEEENAGQESDSDIFSDGAETVKKANDQSDFEMNSTIAETAKEIPVKDLKKVGSGEGGGDVQWVFRFQVSKTGQYRMITEPQFEFGYVNSITYYDSDFNICQTTDTETEKNIITCEAGKTYYAMLDGGGFYDGLVVGIYPIVTGILDVKIPEQYQAVWDGSVDLRSRGAQITYALSDGTTEKYVRNAYDDSRLAVVNDEGEWVSTITKPGTYKLNIKIYKYFNRDYCKLYTLKDIGTITLKDQQEYINTMTPQDITSGKDMVTAASDQLFQFTPTESCQYRLTSVDERNDGIKIYLLDENRNIIDTQYGEMVHSLTAGKKYYYLIRGNYLSDNDPGEGDGLGDFGDHFTTKLTQLKPIKSIELNQKEIFLEASYGYYHDYELLNKLLVKVTYSDGNVEKLQGVHEKTKQGDYIHADFSEVKSNEWGDILPGEYTIPFTIGEQKAEVKVVVGNVKDYFTKNAVALTVDTPYITDSITEQTDYYYKFTAPEDNYYEVEDSCDNEEHGRTYQTFLWDSNEEDLRKNVVKLKKGESIYIQICSHSDEGYHITLNVKKLNYILSGIELISPPQTDYIGGIDCQPLGLYDNNINTENLKIKATYTDGVTEELGFYDISRNGKKIECEADFRDDNYEYIGNNIKITLGDFHVRVKANVTYFYDYFKSLDKEKVETLKAKSDKMITWNKNRGYLYKFIPSETAKYILSIKSEDANENIKTYGWIYGEEGYEIAHDYGSEENGSFKLENELTAGKTYYYLVRPGDVLTGNSVLQLRKEGDEEQVIVKLNKKSATYEYTGTEIKPQITVSCGEKTLIEGIDYQVAYHNNINAGNASMDIEPVAGKTDFEKQTISFTINPQNIEKTSVSAIPDQIYTGKPLTPTVKVTVNGKKIKSGVDYVLSYKNNSNVGTATVTISGKGNYTGCITKQFKINRKAAGKIIYNLNGGTQNKNNKTTLNGKTIKLYNPTRKGYTFSGWYTDKSLKKKITSISSKTTSNVTLYAKWTKVSACKAPAKVTLKNSKAKTMTVSVSSVSGAKGYEISYATNAKFTKAVKKVQTGRTLSASKLSKGKTYYVRVRAYKVDSTGAKIYGKYSKTVKIKITK